MRYINKPTLDVKDVFRDCVQNRNNKAELLLCLEHICFKSTEFDELMIAGQVSSIEEEDYILDIHKDEFKKVYNQNMAREGKEGNGHYKTIINKALHGKCPFCGISRANTLDHYMPKTKFPSLAVTPLNLIPSCGDCNKGKGANVGKIRCEDALHPYYDNIDTEIWLKCDINHNNEFIIKYKVIKPESWTEELYLRTQKFFEDTELNVKFSSSANDEYSCRMSAFSKHYMKDTKEGFKEFVYESLEGYETSYTNSWISAFYREIYTSEWYYEVWLLSKCKSLE